MSKDVFTRIYEEHLWGGISKSGPGSDLTQTEILIREIPVILNRYNIKKIIDAPCGDFNWMKFVNLSNVEYLGCDIVESVVVKNKQYESTSIKFDVLDIVNDELPTGDLIFVRDCLVHFSYDMIFKFLNNLKNSDIKYLMTTSFINRNYNYDINCGEWRPLNLMCSPFNLPRPIDIIIEKCSEGNGAFSDKSICVWEVEHI